MRCVLLLTAIVLMAANAAFPQEPMAVYQASVLKSTQATAQAALSEFSQLVTARNFKALGFDSPRDIRQAVLGDPFGEYMVRLDELKKFTSDINPVDLLHPTERITYPLLVEGATRSGVTVVKRDGKWIPEGIGGANYTRILNEVRSQAVQETGRNSTDFFAVRVPALNMTFLGTGNGSELTLIPILSDPTYGLIRGERIPAREVFETIARGAREHNDLPGAR